MAGYKGDWMSKRQRIRELERRVEELRHEVDKLRGEGEVAVWPFVPCPYSPAGRRLPDPTLPIGVPCLPYEPSPSRVNKLWPITTDNSSMLGSVVDATPSGHIGPRTYEVIF